MGFYLTLWSFIFEYAAPAYIPTVSDSYDIVCYITGGLLAGLYWNFEFVPRKLRI